MTSTTRHQLWSRSVQRLLPVCLAATTGCASIFGPYSAVEPRSAEQQTSVPQSTLTQSQPIVAPGRLKTLNKPEFDLPQAQPSGFTHHKEDAVSQSTERQATATSPAENPFLAMARERTIQQTSLPTAAALPVTANTSATTFHAAQPRMPTSQDGCPPAAEFTVAASPLVQAYPDEFIFDGGDRDHPVHYSGGTMAGLDTEDTVVEFRDHNGDNHVTASNRVAVYAPRFGAIRTVTGPDTGVKVDKAVRATDIAGLNSLHEERGLDINVVSVPLAGLAIRESASGIENSQPAHLTRKSDSPVQNNKVDHGFEAKTIAGPGTLELSSILELSLQILEPASSKIQTGFGETASTTQATQTYATFRVQATVGSEKDAGRKGEIHITKEASPLVAKAGDLITFTIHFRNIGDHNANDVRIIDNLTPRLLYIEGTGQIEAPDGAGGTLAAVPNKEGSQTLEFQLDQPLKGGESGTITFRAKVR